MCCPILQLFNIIAGCFAAVTVHARFNGIITISVLLKLLNSDLSLPTELLPRPEAIKDTNDEIIGGIIV